MQSSQFIFSRNYRLQRHIVFWFCWWLFCTIIYAFAPSLVLLSVKTRLSISGTEALLFLVPHMFLSYSLMYFVVPKLLLKSRYLITALAVVILFFITAVISAVVGTYFIANIREYFFPSTANLFLHNYREVSFFMSLLAGLRGGVTIAGMAAAIKLMKHWYLKEQRNMQLQKENMQSQLQLLKAQVHPHFLFNTLNNIYSYTQNTSAIASQLVMGLSDMLRCILYECNQSQIPLGKELKMVQDYISLEKIRYGNKLEVHIEVPEKADDFSIAPLLLLPFVENSFKHGASQVLDQPWISLSVSVVKHTMRMKLVNGKAENYAGGGGAGIGIINVRKRLDLLYPHKYMLKIQDEEDVFIVDLKIELERAGTVHTVNPVKNTVYE